MKTYPGTPVGLGTYADTHNHPIGKQNLRYTRITKETRDYIAGLLRLKVQADEIVCDYLPLLRPFAEYSHSRSNFFTAASTMTIRMMTSHAARISFNCLMFAVSKRKLKRKKYIYIPRMVLQFSNWLRTFAPRVTFSHSKQRMILSRTNLSLQKIHSVSSFRLNGNEECSRNTVQLCYALTEHTTQLCMKIRP